MALLSLYHLVLWCGIGCVFYIYGLLIQPVYLIGPVSIVLAFIYSIANRVGYERRITSSIGFILTLIILLILIQVIVKANIGVLWNFALCLFIYVAMILVSIRLSFNECVRIIVKVTWLLAAYAIIDGCWRLLHPNPEQIFPGNPFFYRFKDNSLMFEDSNFVGAVLVVAYGALKYISTEFKLRNKMLFIFLWLATVLTYSRASIISLIAIEFFCLFWRFNKLNKIIIIAIFVSVFAYSFSFLFEDGSFRTKFYIIDLFMNTYPTLSLENKLFGVGLGNSFEHLGIGAHSVIVVYGFELGWIGTLAQLFILVFMIIASRGAVLFVLFPYYVNGFSLTAIAIPLLFFLSALITVISSKVRYGNNKRFNPNI